MKILLVEPAFRRRTAAMNKNKPNIPDDSLWYPPIGLMKIARYHKNKNDKVVFVRGIPDYKKKFPIKEKWDIIYIATVFSFHYEKVIETIKFFKDFGHQIFVGGVLATLHPTEIFLDTGVRPILGLLTSSSVLGFEDNVNIDKLTPDYSILADTHYAIYDTFYAYTTRGCNNNCPWCAVSKIEPIYEDYIDIKEQILSLRKEFGDFSQLKLMDNNILMSPHLEQIVDDLMSLGYGRKQKNKHGKNRVVDFNQGVDASFINIETISLLKKINIVPLRIAFDKIAEKEIYIKAVELAFKHGFRKISNYLLYNYKDTPLDLYERIKINIDLNDKWKNLPNNIRGQVYSYPMRYAPINEELGEKAYQTRNFFQTIDIKSIDWLNSPVWTPKFSRSIDVIRGVANGAIPTVPSLAKRAVGRNVEEFISNLYMPEEMLRYRNKYERTVYPEEKKRTPGNGEIEEFREFIINLLHKQDDHFYFFHNAVSSNNKSVINDAILHTHNIEIIHWLKKYLI